MGGGTQCARDISIGCPGLEAAPRRDEYQQATGVQGANRFSWPIMWLANVYQFLAPCLRNRLLRVYVITPTFTKHYTLPGLIMFI